MRRALAIVTAIFAALSLTGCAGGPATGPTDYRPSGGDVVYAVCTDLQTQKFQAQGQGDQSQAMADGHETTVAALLDAGADPNLKNDLGRSPLMLA